MKRINRGLYGFNPDFIRVIRGYFFRVAAAFLAEREREAAERLFAALRA